MTELKKIYNFKDEKLFELARTHTSYANEHKTKKQGTNQRLEFLGDSVLSIIVSEYIYTHYSHLPEGSLTKIRADVVCEKSLYEIAVKLGVGDCLLLGKGEEKAGGRQRVSILADATEAIIGAIYLDSDLETAKNAVLPLLTEKITTAASKEGRKDYKTTLQEYIQRDGAATIVYETVAQTGPDHDKTYDVEVTVNGKKSGFGRGKTKKEAEQMAAKDAMEKLL